MKLYSPWYGDSTPSVLRSGYTPGVFRKLLNRSRRGKAYEGVVVYAGHPQIEGLLPGHYGVTKKDEVDVHCRLEGDHENGWTRVS